MLDVNLFEIFRVGEEERIFGLPLVVPFSTPCCQIPPSVRLWVPLTHDIVALWDTTGGIFRKYQLVFRGNYERFSRVRVWVTLRHDIVALSGTKCGIFKQYQLVLRGTDD